MNECIDTEIREILPDLVHGSLDGETKRRVEAHLAACDSCTEDLRVLRAVKGAAVFAPAINVDSIVRQIPPYRMTVPGVDQRKRTRMVSWLVAAGFALAVVGGGSVVMSNQSRSTATVASAVTPAPSSQAPVGSATPDSMVAMPGYAQVVVTSGSTPTLALASSADLSSLSDDDLVQLMDDMGNFDALPAAEPEPVIAVDTGDSL
jgi:anti-sigma factor RsiW